MWRADVGTAPWRSRWLAAVTLRSRGRTRVHKSRARRCGGLRELHSGLIPDYVTWVMVGVAVFGRGGGGVVAARIRLKMRMEILGARAGRIPMRCFRLVRPDSMYERPIPERHRIIFYLGHLEAFDWNLIGRYALDRPAVPRRVRPALRVRHRPAAGTAAGGPAVGLAGDRGGRALLPAGPRQRSTRSPIPEQLLHVAVEHRLMHAETFAYILHQLPYEQKIAPAAPEIRGRAAARRARG